MEIFHLKYFICVADECHFARAASRLQMAPSPLSRRIKDLERELGVELFERSYHQVRLTEAGERLLPHARRVVDDFQSVREVAVGTASKPVTVGFAPNVAPETRVRFIDGARSAIEGLRLTIKLQSNAQVIAGVRKGTIDFGLIHGRVEDPQLCWTFVECQPVGVAVGVGIGFDDCDSIALSDLCDMPFVDTRPDRASVFQRSNDELLRQKGIVRRIFVDSDRQEDLAPIVSAGQGFTFVGLRAGATFKAFVGEPVIIRPVRDANLRLTTGLIYLESASKRAGIVRDLADVVTTNLTGFDGSATRDEHVKSGA